VTGLPAEFWDHTHAPAVTVARRYRDFVEADEVRNHLYEWAMRPKNLKRVTLVFLEVDPSDEEGVKEQRRQMFYLGKDLRIAAERYCRKQKALSLGYEHTDEFFYTKGMIRELLPLVYDSGWRGTVGGQPDREQGRVSKRPVDEGGNLPMMVADLTAAIPQLSIEQRVVLDLVFGDELHPELVALELGVTVAAVEARIERACVRLVELTGGESPWVVGRRRVLSNAQANALTHKQTG